jgi:hypothetical protein
LPWIGSGQTAPPMGSITPLVVPVANATSSGSGGQSLHTGVGGKHTVAFFTFLLALGALL